MTISRRPTAHPLLGLFFDGDAPFKVFLKMGLMLFVTLGSGGEAFGQTNKPGALDPRAVKIQVPPAFPSDHLYTAVSASTVTSSSLPSHQWVIQHVPPRAPGWFDPHLLPGPVCICAIFPTPLSVGITYKTTLPSDKPGPHIYWLQRSGNLQLFWQNVISQDSPSTNGNRYSDLLVDEKPDPNYSFYRVAVQ